MPLLRPMNRRRAGLTLIEVLTAMAITMVVVGSVAAAFIQVIRASDEADAMMRANVSARAAVDAIARDLRQLSIDTAPGYEYFILRSATLAYGNNIDDDDDGAVDEEIFDGIHTAGIWSDAHATVNGLPEREDYVGAADLGDNNVDTDCLFSRDVVEFIQPPGLLSPTSRRRFVRYYIGDNVFENERDVLVRDYIEGPTTSLAGTRVIEPVTFDVVSLDILAWNANDDVRGPVPAKPYWVNDWDASARVFPNSRPIGSPFGTPPFKLPAAFLVRVTVNAERLPLSEIPDWPSPTRPLRTVTLETVVTVETITSSLAYFQYIRQ